VSVDLCCLQTCVAKQFLYHTEVSAPVEQVSGKAVAQRMRVGGRHGSAVEEAAHVAGTEAPPETIEEKRVGRTVGEGELCSSVSDPSFHGYRRRQADRDLPLFGSLPPDGDEQASYIDIADTEPAQLGDAKAGTIEQLKDRAITEADRQRVVAHPGRGVVEESVQIAWAQDPR
jgi:hypothetical protein